MPVGIFLAPVREHPRGGRPMRYCAAEDYQDLIAADGGDWQCAETLGNHTLIKIRASAATLQTINADPQFIRLPKDRLDDPLADLTVAQRNALRNKILELGYTAAEITAALGNDLRQRTLREVLLFMVSRHRDPVMNVNTGTITFEAQDNGVVGTLAELDRVADA